MKSFNKSIITEITLEENVQRDNETTKLDFYEEKMVKLAKRIKNLDGYNSELYLIDLEQTVKRLEFFYNYLVPQQNGDPLKTNYKLNVKEHQLILVRLGIGYPKELYDNHYCYVYKIFSNKMLVIPTTSIKDASTPSKYQFDIDILDFINEKKTRMQFNEMRVVDKMRAFDSKKYNTIYDVKTSREEICQKLFGVLFQ